MWCGGSIFLITINWYTPIKEYFWRVISNMISLKGDETSNHEVETLYSLWEKLCKLGQMAFFDNASHLPR